MSRNAIISIIGSHVYDENEEVVEIVTPGTYSKQNDGFVINYDEPGEQGEDGNPPKTTIRTGGGCVFVSRTGDAVSQMVFEQGRRHVFYYNTDVGGVTVGVCASRVEVVLDEELGGRIEIDYSIDFDSAVTGDNRFALNLSPSEHAPVVPEKYGGGPWFHI